jgi:4-amino-4-deoxy-L-arabinose transferase-like glycosyltransferase
VSDAEAETPPRASSASSTHGRTAAGIVVAILAGWTLRLARPEVHSFWIDEGLTLLAAQSGDMLDFLRWDSHPPLSFLIVRGWIALFGESDLALRLLPAIVSCVSLVLFARLVQAWLGGGRAAAAVALYAVAPILVNSAHEVRMYAFVELATLCVLLAARAAWRAPSPNRWFALAAATAVATGLHYYGSFAGLAVIAHAILRRASGTGPARGIVSTAAACALGVGVWIPTFLTLVPAQMANPWPRIVQTDARSLAELPLRLVASDLIVLVEHGIPWVGWLLAAGCAGALLLALARAIRVADEGLREALIACAVPVIAALILATVAGGAFHPRYLTPAIPGTIAAIAAGLFVLRPAALPRVAIGVVVACALATSVLQLSENRREDYRAVCAEIRERWQDGDRLLVLVCVPDVQRLATVSHYLRDRPDILGGVLDPDAYLSGRERPAPGTRVHVLWREATICFEPYAKLRDTHAFQEESPARFRIHRYLTTAPQ